jgi:peptidoglycan/LPS O-acetylase OafA/YrhL
LNTKQETDHIPALDGVRGVAILLVLLVHFIPPVAMQWRVAEWFMKIFSTGGWVGVDLFFVLSGFLITSILLRTKHTPSYFTNFYMRRTLRIVPIYFLVLFIIFAVLPIFVSTPSFTILQRNQLYFWLYAANIGFFTVGPEAMGSDVADPAVYWSLAVEEHFYLVWPAVIFFCRTRTVIIFCLSIIGATFLIRCAGAAISDNSMFFYLTPCRMDGLAAGALVAAILHQRGIAALRKWIWLGATIAASTTVTLLAFFLHMKGLWAGHWFMRTVGLSLLAGLFASILLIAVTQPSGTLSKLLASRPLRFFGKHSYGMYVIHGLILPALLILIPASTWMSAFGEQVMIGALTLTFTKIAICVVFAVISFQFYEAPFLGLKRFFEADKTLPLQASALSESSNILLPPHAVQESVKIRSDTR